MNDKLESRQRTTLRQSNFELLRIISMLLIIAHHFAIHGGYSDVLKINACFIKILEIGGKLGVNIFILISGYFLIDLQFNYKKIIKLLFETTFYSFFIYIIFLACGKTGFTFVKLLSALFPIFSGTYWFATSYIITYCLSSCLNAIIKNCSKRYLIFVLFLLIFIQSVILTFCGSNIFSDTGWFLTLYMTAAFLKLYPVKLFNSLKFTTTTAVLTFILITVFNIFTDINLWTTTNFVCLVCSLSIFCTAKNIKLRYNKVINRIAATVFGIYLIHDNPILREFLWIELLNCPIHARLELFIVFALIIIAIVFIVCMLIDFFRQFIFYLIKKAIVKLKKD